MVTLPAVLAIDPGPGDIDPRGTCSRRSCLRRPQTFFDRARPANRSHAPEREDVVQPCACITSDLRRRMPAASFEHDRASRRRDDRPRSSGSPETLLKPACASHAGADRRRRHPTADWLDPSLRFFHQRERRPWSRAVTRACMRSAIGSRHNPVVPPCCRIDGPQLVVMAGAACATTPLAEVADEGSEGGDALDLAVRVEAVSARITSGQLSRQRDEVTAVPTARAQIATLLSDQFSRRRRKSATECGSYRSFQVVNHY